MAKPTKTAPKRTNKSKTKKGKLDFLTNRINFKSRKTQFILTILVFALVGGAWFTYKSFAATEVYSYSPVNGTLKCYNKIVTSCSQISDTGIGKNSTTVLKFDGGHGVKATSKPMASIGGKYRICIVAKGSRAKFSSPSLRSSVMPLHSPTKYTNFCTNSVYQEPNELKAPTIRVDGSTVDIAMMMVERMGQPATNSAPAPAK